MHENGPLDSANASDAPDEYLLGARDRAIVEAAIALLKKIIVAPFTRREELVSIAKALQALTALPAPTPIDPYIRISLGGPHRRFGEHEIWHWWAVEIDQQSVSIDSGGHFYRASTGGDTFTTLQWYAQPGTEPDCMISLEPIINDAKPFPKEVDAMDLSEPDYSLTVDDDANPGLGEDEEEPEVDDANPPQQEPTDAEGRLSELADEQEGRRQRQTYANPSDTCDYCGCRLGERTYFVDARLRGRMMFGCLCAECFFEQGEGIGWGCGQIYKRQPDGSWLMVAGFRPAD